MGKQAQIKDFHTNNKVCFTKKNDVSFNFVSANAPHGSKQRIFNIYVFFVKKI